jgi:tocopherol O-methyltransferase
MLSQEQYYNNIEQYYEQTISSYKDGWAMDKAQAIHYGYWDEPVKNFASSLIRMNEIMAEAAQIQQGAILLDAGCGVGGSSFYLAKHFKAKCTGISLSHTQMQIALKYQQQLGLKEFTDFKIMDYCKTNFADNSFDVVWGCESICYAYNKKDLLKEVYRILKPGGVFVMADGMVTQYKNNEHPTIRKWLNGWQVNYLETPERWQEHGAAIGFKDFLFRDITKFTKQSSKRLFLIWLACQPWLVKNKLFGKTKWSDIQKDNIKACYHQYIGMNKGLWIYGLLTMKK